MNCPRRHICWQSKRLYGEGAPGWRAAGEGTQEDCSTTWLAVSDFMVVGLVSRLSLDNHSDSGSVMVAHASLSQHGFQRAGFWEIGRTCKLVLPLSSWPFLNSSTHGSLLVPGPCIVKIIHVSDYDLAWPGLAVSVSVSLMLTSQTLY